MKLSTLTNGAFRHAWARIKGGNSGSSITIFLTLRCNLNCSYCDFPRNDTKRELTEGELGQLLRGLRRHGTFRLGLSGGEPLLRDDFGRIARDAADLGFMTSLVTNGVLLAPRVDEVLCIDYVLCTIEGNEAVHDAIRGPGTYKAAVAGMQALRNAGHRRLGIICPVHDQNVYVLEEPLRMAEELGALAFYQPTQIREGWRGAPYGGTLSEERLFEAFSTIRAWKAAGRKVGNSRHYLDLIVDGSSNKRFAGDCAAGRYFFTILPDGTLIPCCMVRWEENGIVMDLQRPSEAIMRSTRPACSGCTILPYMENTFLMKMHLPTLWNALRW